MAKKTLFLRGAFRSHDGWQTVFYGPDHAVLGTTFVELNHVAQLVEDWSWWNRAYTRWLIRARGYRLVSAAATLPAVASVEELAQQKSGAVFWLQPRHNYSEFQPPKVALGEHAAYVFDYYKREFAPRDDRPFIAYFPKALLYGRQFSILDPLRRAFEECFTRDRRWRKGIPKRSEKIQPKKVSGTYLLACAESHNHFCHLFCDVLPRLKLFEEAGLDGKFPYILPPPSHEFAAEASRMMGLEKNGSVIWDDGCWELDGLYFVSAFKKFCSWTPESASWIRQKLVPEIETKPLGTKLYYISRRNAFRPVQNEDALLDALKPWGLTVVEPDRLSLKEQMAMFADARLVMGPHGAGIQNALWAPRGCRILELVSPRYFSGVYWTLAESLGNPYGLVTGDTPLQGEATRIATTFDPALVNRALDVLLK
jgi:hypothetical protein